MASLRPAWSNTTEKFLCSRIFAAVEWKRHRHSQFSNALPHCTAAEHMGHARKTWKETWLALRRRRGIRSFNKGSEIRQLRCCRQFHQLWAQCELVKWQSFKSQTLSSKKIAFLENLTFHKWMIAKPYPEIEGIRRTIPKFKDNPSLRPLIKLPDFTDN